MFPARYTQGSIATHLILMTSSTALGLLTIFLSELVDIYFLGLIGEAEITALGFAGPIIFFSLSLNIGLSIACSALVSIALGSGNTASSRETVTHSLVSAFIISLPLALILWFYLPTLLSLMGASGQALELANAYTSIVIIGMPLLAVAMSMGSIMRAKGDAKNSMLIYIVAGLSNIVLDPILIFGLDLGVTGAALATLISRIIMLAMAYHIIVNRDQLVGAFNLHHYRQELSSYTKIAFPAILTNLSTPLSMAYVTYAMAQFGDSAVAGVAIINKIQPVAFVGLFALSSVIGPIAGQNFGAKKFDRVSKTLFESIRFTLIYCAIVSAILWLSQWWFVPLFGGSAAANELVYLFCSGLSLIFIFNGITFLTNALFNNLGVAYYATIINILKATVGTIPFVILGANIAGVEGVLWGLFAGSIFIAVIGLLLAIKLVNKFQA
ncbi:MAG: putative MATE family efflux protein [Cellvibrionaceae bacterium]|jgi:putative MATE family efflux protein